MDSALPARQTPAPVAHSDVVRYFAYGSNMQTATFVGRRGIQFRRARAACASGWRLVLDKPPMVPIGEGFASIVADAAATVYGVLYEITVEDLAHIDLTEGVLIDNYQRVEIPVAPLDAPDDPLSAFTLTTPKRDPSLRPSERYMGLVIEGAEEHGLPPEWVAFLRSIPTCRESAASAAFRPHLDLAMRRRRDGE